MKITACKLNHLTDPVGYELSSPRVSWNVEEAEGGAQESARVQVSLREDMTEPVFDTGYGMLSCLGEPLRLTLNPRTRYYWRVTVRSNAGEEAASEVQFFETGKEDEPWQGQWITCKEQKKGSPLFVRKIRLSGQVASARLYICGLGLYEASWNGNRIGDEYLTPYCNAYDKWLQYQTYDVTDFLIGDGELQVLLGDGWYKGRFGFRSRSKSKGYYGDHYMLIAELHVIYQDGREEITGTDQSWQVFQSKITFSNIYDGEHADDTLQSLKKQKPVPALVVSAAKIPKAPLCARYSQPVKIIERLPVRILKTPRGETVLDAGQNITGGFELRVRLRKGKKLRLQFGEVLQDGNFYRDNLRSAKAEYIYTGDGKEKVIRPRFTFYGYRYVKVEGIDDLKKGDFTALAYSTELESVGTLITGDKKVDKLISNIRWGCLDNFVDVPTDCPQRDERMGWTADTQVFVPSATYMQDTYAFYRKFLHDMALEQTSDKNRGGVPFTIPSFGQPAGSAVWGDAATIIPWTLYRFYGDRTILEEQFDSMRSWVDYITKKDGKDCGWRREFHFGDWLALDVPGADVGSTSGATDKAFIADVYYMYSAEIVADAALLTGRAAQAREYRLLAQRLRDRIRAEYYSPNGRCCCDTQTGLLLTLRHDLAPKEQTANRLRQKLMDNDCKLNCGFVGAPLLCMVLSENGMSDLAAKLLMNRSYPGWLHEVILGATTVWERWNSLDEDGHISSTGMNSLNHYAYGSVLEWMYAHLAGIKEIDPGFTRVRLAPEPVKELGYIDCTWRSPVGIWKSSWRITDDKYDISVTVPFGAEAELLLPQAPESIFEDVSNPVFRSVHDGVCYLRAGSYEVSYRQIDF